MLRRNKKKIAIIAALCFGLFFFAIPALYLEEVEDFLVSKGYYFEVRKVKGLFLSDKRADDLKNKIISVFPEIATPHISDFEKVSLIREWVHSQVNIASGDLAFDSGLKEYKYYTLTAPDLFELFSAEDGGVLCGGVAYSLMQTYKLFGYNSARVDMGDPLYTTHVVTLVQIDVDGETRWSVQDALFNLTFLDVHNKPVDYFSLLELAHANKSNQIVTQWGSAPPPDSLTLMNTNIIKKPYEVHEDSFLPYIEVMSPRFKEDGYDADIASFYLYPITFDGLEWRSLEKRARGILESA